MVKFESGAVSFCALRAWASAPCQVAASTVSRDAGDASDLESDVISTNQRIRCSAREATSDRCLAEPIRGGISFGIRNPKSGDGASGGFADVPPVLRAREA